MLTNKVVKKTLAITRIIIFVPSHIMAFAVDLLRFIPFALSMYMFVMFLIWLPLISAALITGWLWRKAPPLRVPLALIGIPIVVITDTFSQLTLMPDPDNTLGNSKACSSWPLLPEMTSHSKSYGV